MANDLRLAGPDTVVVVGRVTLSIIACDGLGLLDIVGSNIASVGRLQASGILGLDGCEDGVGSGDGILLGGGITGVSSRVEKDEGALFGSDGGEVTLVNCALQSSDAVSVDELSTLPGGGTGGTIGKGDGGDTGKGGGSDSTHGSTAVHAQSGAGTLR